MSTIAEKIFARASGKGEAEAGDIVMADIDIACHGRYRYSYDA